MSSDRPNMSHIRRYGSLNDIDRGNRPYGTDHEKFSTKANQANQANQMLNVTNRPGDSNHSNELKIETDARSTSESDDGLTLVELQAIGAFVPLHNSHNNGEVTGEQSNTTRSIDQPSNGGVCMAEMQEHCVESRSWRADVRRVFHRSGGASNDFSAKTPSRRKFAAHNRPRRPAPTMPRGVDPQMARLKKRPSLFLRLLDRTLKQQNHSHVGYERITGTTGVFRWVDSVFKRTAVLIPLRAPGGEPSLALVDELRRYFGSDEITKQLLMLTSNAKGNDFIHHPINLYLLDRRQLKQERERNFEGRPPPRSNRSYLSLRNSRLCSSSGIRNFNRQGNNWKLLEFSKVANPDIGDGQLSFAGERFGMIVVVIAMLMKRIFLQIFHRGC